MCQTSQVDARNFVDSHPQTRSLIYSIPFLVQFQLLGREGQAGQINQFSQKE
jgi:hypothetical protein